MPHFIIKEDDIILLSFKEENGEGSRIQTEC